MPISTLAPECVTQTFNNFLVCLSVSLSLSLSHYLFSVCCCLLAYCFFQPSLAPFLYPFPFYTAPSFFPAARRGQHPLVATDHNQQVKTKKPKPTHKSSKRRSETPPGHPKGRPRIRKNLNKSKFAIFITIVEITHARHTKRPKRGTPN